MKIIFPDTNGSFELFEKHLTAIIGNKKESMIDLCCCFAPITSKLNFKRRWFVDAIERTIPDQKCFIKADVLGDHPIFQEHYEIATCLDGIEHFKKDLGWELINRMKTIADKVIIFTPSDPWCIEGEDSERYHNDPESHKSLWSPDELPNWAHFVFPKYHSSLGIGAFFSWYCEDIEQDFLRVKKKLKLE